MGEFTAIKVDGLKALNRDLKAFAPVVKKKFTKDLKSIAESVAQDARSRMPVRSGAAKKSVKASTAGGGAAIRIGSASVPYTPWLDFGGTLKKVGGRHNEQSRPVLKDGRYVYPAIKANRVKIEKAADVAVTEAKRETGL